MKFKFRKLSLLLGDVFTLYAALFFALFLRNYFSHTDATWSSHFWPFTQIFVVWLLIFYISDIYNIHTAVNNAKFYRQLFRGITISSFISILYFYANPTIGISPKTNLIIFVIILTILMVLWRNLFNWLAGSYLSKKNILYLGNSDQIREIVELTKTMPHLGYTVAAILNEEEVIQEENNPTLFGEKIKLEDIIAQKNISTIVLGSHLVFSEKLRTALFNCIKFKIDIIRLSKFYEDLTNKISLETINKAWFLENLNEGSKKKFDTIKRIYDLLFALILILITLPLWPIIIIIITLESPGSAFFKQERLGKLERTFTMLKFRTMKITDNNFQPTTSNDQRITKFGNFLRRSRLDEIPQLINIVKGDMSFVGPRPERPELAHKLEENVPFFKERLLVKPGLTGLDQISGEYHSPSLEDTLKKMQYDLYYIKNRSIYLDLSILLKTVMTVLSKAGR